MCSVMASNLTDHENAVLTPHFVTTFTTIGAISTIHSIVLHKMAISTDPAWPVG